MKDRNILRKIKDPTTKRLFLAALAGGWTYRTSGGHLVLRSPTGQTVVTGITASDHRAGKNLESTFRQFGVVL